MSDSVFNSPQQCIFCIEDSVDELQCTRCKSSLHYTCTLGFDPPEAFKSSDVKVNYVCPPCKVGSSYELLHRALDAHSKHRLHSSPIHGNTSHRYQDDHDSVSSVTSLQGDLEAEESRRPNQTVVTVVSEHLLSHSAPASAHPEPGHPPPAPASTRDYHGREEAQPLLTPLNEHCESKMKKLSYTLRSLFINPPGNATTILIGDSLQKGLVKKDIDRNTDSIRIRSVGSLCIVATVQALSQHRRTHPKIKKVVFTLGINDHLHREFHCGDETPRYFKGLSVEASRVFPNATLYFVVPYKGMVGHDVTNFVQGDLLKLLKENCPKIRRLVPPSLAGKVSDGGIHPSGTGTAVLTKWYSKSFVPPATRVFNQNSGRKSLGRPYSMAHIPPDTPTMEPVASGAPTQHQPKLHHLPSHPLHPQQSSSAYDGLAGEIVGAFKEMMYMWGHPPPQPNRYQAQQWPPIRPY